MGPEGIFKGNYKDVEQNEADVYLEEEEEEDEEEEEEENEKPKDDRSLKCHHKQKLTPEMILKLRRKKRVSFEFCDCIISDEIVNHVEKDESNLKLSTKIMSRYS